VVDGRRQSVHADDDADKDARGLRLPDDVLPAGLGIRGLNRTQTIRKVKITEICSTDDRAPPYNTLPTEQLDTTKG
jgi:hypothetical protein